MRRATMFVPLCIQCSNLPGTVTRNKVTLGHANRYRHSFAAELPRGPVKFRVSRERSVVLCSQLNFEIIALNCEFYEFCTPPCNVYLRVVSLILAVLPYSIAFIPLHACTVPVLTQKLCTPDHGKLIKVHV